MSTVFNYWWLGTTRVSSPRVPRTRTRACLVFSGPQLHAMRKKKLEAHSELSIAQDVTEVGLSCAKLKPRSWSSGDVAESLCSTKEGLFLESAAKLGNGVDGDRADPVPSPKKTQCHIEVFTKQPDKKDSETEYRQSPGSWKETVV